MLYGTILTCFCINLKSVVAHASATLIIFGILYVVL